MRQALPILWFILGIVATGISVYQGLTAAPSMAGDPAFLIQLAPMTLGSLVTIVGVALAYALMLRAEKVVAIIVIGCIHLVFAIIARVGQFIGEEARLDLMYDDKLNSAAASMMGLGYSISAALSLLGGLMFIVALIVALNSRSRESIVENY